MSLRFDVITLFPFSDQVVPEVVPTMVVGSNDDGVVADAREDVFGATGFEDVIPLVGVLEVADKEDQGDDPEQHARESPSPSLNLADQPFHAEADGDAQEKGCRYEVGHDVGDRVVDNEEKQPGEAESGTRQDPRARPRGRDRGLHGEDRGRSGCRPGR